MRGGGGDIGLLQAEAFAERGFKVEAGGVGGVEGDADEADPVRLGQGLVDAEAGGAELFGDLFLRQAFDVIGPCNLREEPLFRVDLGQFRARAIRFLLLHRAHGQAAHQMF